MTSKPHSVHAEMIPTRERIAKAHSRLPAEWHGWHAQQANGGAGHFGYYNSREACYICTLLDLVDSLEEQLETAHTALREIAVGHDDPAWIGCDKAMLRARAALNSNPASRQEENA